MMHIEIKARDSVDGSLDTWWVDIGLQKLTAFKEAFELISAVINYDVRKLVEDDGSRHLASDMAALLYRIADEVKALGIADPDGKTVVTMMRGEDSAIDFSLARET